MDNPHNRAKHLRRHLLVNLEVIGKDKISSALKNLFYEVLDLLALLFADIVRGWYFELAVCQKFLFAWLSFEWNVAQQDADVILCYIIFRIEVKPEVKVPHRRTYIWNVIFIFSSKLLQKIRNIPATNWDS